MSETQEKIILEETSRNFRTEIPNIIFEMLETGELSLSEFTLYLVYRRIAGENSECWTSTRTLANKCVMNKDTVTKSKKRLSLPFESLEGKPLIKITKGDRKKEETDTVVVVDIWRENNEFFKKRLRVRNEGGRVVRNKGTEEDPFKKIPIKNPPLSSPPETKKVDPPSEKKEEEDFSKFNFLEGTTLSPKEKSRLRKDYTPDELKRALKISETQSIKKTLMHLLLHILKNPDDWPDKPSNETLTPNQQKALQVNAKFAKLDANKAKSNEELIVNKNLMWARSKDYAGQHSLNSHDFIADMKDFENWIEDELRKRKKQNGAN